VPRHRVNDCRHSLARENLESGLEQNVCVVRGRQEGGKDTAGGSVRPQGCGGRGGEGSSLRIVSPRKVTFASALGLKMRRAVEWSVTRWIVC